MTDIIILLVESLITLQLVILAPLVLIFRSGGPKIVLFKILRINMIFLKIYDHDGTPYSKMFKMSDIKTLSPPHLFYKGLIRYIDNTNFTRRFGIPENQYHIDNSLPLPVVRGYRDTILDPNTITKSYNTDILRRLLNLGKEATPKKPSVKGTIIMIIVILLAGLAGLWVSFKLI